MPDRLSETQKDELIEVLQSSVSEQHDLVSEVKALRQSNRTLRAIVSGLAILIVVGAIAISLSIFGVVRVNNTVDQQNTDRIAGCQVRNSNTDQLVDSQLGESLDNADSLLAVILPSSADPARTEALADQWKAGITKSHNQRIVQIKFVDCDKDGIEGVNHANNDVDLDDFASDPGAVSSSN